MDKEKYKIMYYNNPILTTKCKEIGKIDREVFEFAQYLVNMMIKYDGIGLASNQIGDNRSMVAIAGIEPFNSPVILVNPKIVKYIEPIVNMHTTMWDNLLTPMDDARLLEVNKVRGGPPGIVKYP